MVENEDPEEVESPDADGGNPKMGVGIAIGVAIGAAMGVALDNIWLGMGLGIAIGIGIGAAMGRG
jgi:hypothetical protein